MTKAKLITRERSGAQGVERTAGESVSSGKPGTSALRRGALAESEGAPRGAQRQQRGVWKPVRSYVATAFYKVYGELAGLSETRPALGQYILARALTAIGTKAPRIAASVTIGKSRGEMLTVLRGFEEIRRCLSHIQRAEIAKDQDAALFTFCDGAGRAFSRTGVLSFAPAPGGRSTEVKAVLAGTQSIGRMARATAKLLAEVPRQRLFGDLRRIRQWMETGEIPTTVGQPSGRKAT
jgi:uncharacterized membrane protein